MTVQVAGLHAGGSTGYFVAFVVIGIIAHELGHAAVARLLGGEVDAITIGTGPQLVRLRAGSVALTLRLFPLSGLTVWHGPPAQRRWPRFAVAVAGCAVNLLCAAAVLVAGLSTVVRVQFLAANLLLTAYNLVPVRAIGGGALDGLTALQLLRGSPQALTRQQVGSARDDPSAPEAVALRRQLRGRVDRDRDLDAAELLAHLPAGEPGRPGRPATEDLERIRALVVDERLPAGRRAALAFHVAATGLPGRDPAAGAELAPGELAWCASMLALAAGLAPRAWPVLQALALTLLLQGGAAERAAEVAGQALDWAPGDIPAASRALLEATAGLAAAALLRPADAAERGRRARELDPGCPALPLLDAALAG